MRKKNFKTLRKLKIMKPIDEFKENDETETEIAGNSIVNNFKSPKEKHEITRGISRTY